MSSDIATLYRSMLTTRMYEESISMLWNEGLISGEMHLGTGEEAINVGVVSHLKDGDAMALDHRGTAPLILRGVDAVALIRELIGSPDGLCHGMGGHMHLFSKELLSASSGIVGSSGPAAVGFALAGIHLRPGSISVAFFGEGAMNQGMLLEAMNLASAWRLPVLFLCKDDTWSITTKSSSMTGGSVDDRAAALGVKPAVVDGLDVAAVYDAAEQAVADMRAGSGPHFLHARCVHLEGHFLGYQLKRISEKPVREMRPMVGTLTRSFLHSQGANIKERIQGLRRVTADVLTSIQDSRRATSSDPISLTRARVGLPGHELIALENVIEEEVQGALQKALSGGVQ